MSRASNLAGFTTSISPPANLSVGIITASSVINVGTGLTLSSSGINITGVITATSFSGNGSGLIGVGLGTTGSINTSGIITATTLTIGAGTTALPSISPTGDSNTGIFFPSADTVAISEGGAEALRVDSSGRLLIGTSTARGLDYYGTPQVQIEGLDYQKSFLSIYNNDADDNIGGLLALGRSRGTTIGSNTIVQNGDQLGTVVFYGSDGVNDAASERRGAEISAFVDGTPGAGDMPGRLVFSTTADGSATPTERMRISETGNTGFLNGSTISNTIGLNSPDASSSSKYLILGNRGASNTLNNTGASIFQVRTDGGIANFSANDANLSDRNSKKDISLAADTWDCVKEWEIVNYRYKDQSDDANLNFGIIAQQVAESCPEVITIFEPAKESKVAVLDEEGNEVKPAQEAQPEKLGVKEQQMYWMAIKALQEAMERIEQLETSNTDLLARVIALKTA